MENSVFNFWMPLDIQKSVSDKKTEPEMRIRGYASTPSRDRQDDVIIQKGLDISDFVNYGFFNFNHDAEKIVGYPDKEKTAITPAGFLVEGTLLPGVPLAKSLWETAVALQKSNAPRKLGFSVEGTTLQRDDLGRIVKAKVYNVAITGTPVNPNATWDALVKSFSPDIEKSCSAGYSVSVGDTNSGGVMKNEDLEQAFHVLAKALGDNEKAVESLNALRSCLGLHKSLDTSEMILYFQLTKGLSRQDAINLIQKLPINQ